MGRPTSNDHRRLKLEAWLLREQSSRFLPFLTPDEKRVIAAFVGAPDARGSRRMTSGDAEEAGRAREVLRLSPTSTAEEILWARLAAHVAAVVVSSGRTSPTALFSDMALRPDILHQGNGGVVDKGRRRAGFYS